MDDAMLSDVIGSVQDLHQDDVTIRSVLTAMLKSNPWLAMKFPKLLLHRK